MRQQTVRLVLTALGLLIGLQVAFTALIVLGAAVPDGPVVRTIHEHTEPGRTWGLPEGDGAGGSGTPTTDQAVLTSGLGRPELGPWERAMLMPRLETGSPGHEQVVRLAAGGSGEEELRGYFRYWAGYTVLTRPVLATLGLPGLRLVVGTLLVAGTALAATALARRATPWHVVALAVPLLLGTNILLTPSVSMAHALSFAVAFAGVGLVAAAGPRLPFVVLATVVAASAYSFVDLLTNPVIPWVLAAAVAAGLAYRDTGQVRDLVRHGLAVGAVWPLAWAATWASRWALAVLALGWETASTDIGGQVESRLDLEAAGVVDRVGAATWINLGYWWETSSTAPVLVLLTLVTVVVLLAAAARSGVLRPAPLLLLCAPALVVPVWYELFSNHSQIHVPFTYRYVPAVLSLLLFAAVTVLEASRRRDGTVPGRRRQTEVVEPLDLLARRRHGVEHDPEHQGHPREDHHP